MIQFCEYSFGSINAKTVFTAAVVLFNHVLCTKVDKKADVLFSAIQKICEVLPSQTDNDAITALVLAEIRIIYKNGEILKKVMESKDKIVKVHAPLKDKAANIKEVVLDLFQLLGEE